MYSFPMRFNKLFITQIIIGTSCTDITDRLKMRIPV